ncbi:MULTISPECIES: helix-turn-helix transcriptional regulator [Aeromonas]|nr:transcriptional regulator [Aeromonas salmonicida]
MNSYQIIRSNQLTLELGVSRTTLWRWCSQGILPQPVRLGPRLVGWTRSDINHWLELNKNRGSKS